MQHMGGKTAAEQKKDAALLQEQFEKERARRPAPKFTWTGGGGGGGRGKGFCLEPTKEFEYLMGQVLNPIPRPPFYVTFQFQQQCIGYGFPFISPPFQPMKNTTRSVVPR